MTRPILLPAADRIASPWKNGGGVTSEVAVFPAGASMDDFLWRVSIAEVAEAGAFSRFPMIDRVLAVLEGTLSLAVTGEDAPVLLSSATGAHAFPGDVDAHGTPLDGPVRDLNMMVRRGAWQGTTEVLRPFAPMRIDDLPCCALLVATGPARVERLGETFALDRLDALLIDEAGDAPIMLSSDASLYLIRLTTT
ncbi:MAG TPA: HutD family protein [Sphingomonas sp.]|nr:HutD family protein [Sphingomonas sp.]